MEANSGSAVATQVSCNDAANDASSLKSTAAGPVDKWASNLRRNSFRSAADEAGLLAATTTTAAAATNEDEPTGPVKASVNKQYSFESDGVASVNLFEHICTAEDAVDDGKQQQPQQQQLASSNNNMLPGGDSTTTAAGLMPPRSPHTQSTSPDAESMNKRNEEMLITSEQQQHGASASALASASPSAQVSGTVAVDSANKKATTAASTPNKKNNTTNSTNSTTNNNNNNNTGHQNHGSSKSSTGGSTSASSFAYKYLLEYPFRSIRHYQHTNVLSKAVKLMVLFAVNMALLLPLVPVIVVLFVGKYLLRQSFRLFHVCHLTSTSHDSPDLIPEFITPIELFWLYNSSLIGKFGAPKSKSAAPAPTPGIAVAHDRSASTCACLMFVEGFVAKNTIKNLIENKIVQGGSRTGQHFFDRFTQRLHRMFVYGFVWLNCVNFNIDEHVVEIDESNSIRTQDDLQLYMSTLINTQEFQCDRPLWRLYYKKTFSSNGDKFTLLIFVFHMCFADGVSLVRLLFKGVVDNRNALDVKPRHAFFNYSFDMFTQFVFGWSQLLTTLLFQPSDKNPLHSRYYRSRQFANLNTLQPQQHHPQQQHQQHQYPQQQHPQHPQQQSAASMPVPPPPLLIETSLSTQHGVEIASARRKVLTWSEPYSLIHVNRMKLVTRSKMNDLLLSVVTGTLRAYMQLKGINNPRDFSCLVAVDLTSNKFPARLGQHSTFSQLTVPANSEGCLPRLWHTKQATRRAKRSSDYLFMHFCERVLFGLLPNRVAFRLMRCLANKSTVVAATLGAGDSTLSVVSLANRNVRNLIYFYPSIGNVAISLSVITYGDEVRLALVADPFVVADPKLITDEFTRQLDTLHDLLANRRIPGEIRKLTRPAAEIRGPSLTGMLYETQETTVEEMQQKMTNIQQELQLLSEYVSKLDTSSADYNKQKHMVTIKSENLRKEFRTLLMNFQIRQNLNSQTIPSDDEDDLDQQERFRLRSASIASRMSFSSSSRKNSYFRESAAERETSSRRASISRHVSMSYSSGMSNAVEAFNGKMTPPSNSQHNVTVENEVGQAGGKSSGNHLHVGASGVKHALKKHHSGGRGHHHSHLTPGHAESQSKKPSLANIADPNEENIADDEED